MSDQLRQAVATLQRARSLAEVQRIVRTTARQLLGAQGATFVLRDGEYCFYADEDAISPLWKGQRFPIGECISGWAMRHGEPAVIPDIRLDRRVPQEAYRPTFVRALVMVPIPQTDPVGAIGGYWARPRRASDEEVAQLQSLAAATAQALARFPQVPHTLAMPGRVPAPGTPAATPASR